MSATARTIREALAAAIKTGLGSGWQVSPYVLSQPSPPAVDVRPAGVDYTVAMARGGDNRTFTIRAMAAWNDGQAAQMLLDRLLDSDGGSSMKAIVEKDCTLGGVVADLCVTAASDYKQIASETNITMLAIEFTVEVEGLAS